MKTLIAAIALIALPAIVHAEGTPAPAPGEAPKMKCCCMDKSKPMDCCKERDRAEAGEGEHAGHDMNGSHS